MDQFSMDWAFGVESFLPAWRCLNPRQSHRPPGRGGGRPCCLSSHSANPGGESPAALGLFLQTAPSVRFRSFLYI